MSWHGGTFHRSGISWGEATSHCWNHLTGQRASKMVLWLFSVVSLNKLLTNSWVTSGLMYHDAHVTTVKCHTRSGAAIPTPLNLYALGFHGSALIPSSWGQHGAHLGPTGPRWAPCWPHELCYLGPILHTCMINWNGIALQMWHLLQLKSTMLCINDTGVTSVAWFLRPIMLCLTL